LSLAGPGMLSPVNSNGSDTSKRVSRLDFETLF
jgi:hypothetical protein